MGYPTVYTDVQVVGIGGNFDLQPPLFMDQRVTAVASDQLVGVPPLQRPNVLVSMFDGVNAGQFLRGADVRGWFRKQNIVADNTNYVRFTNNAGVQANIGFSVELIRYSGVGIGVCVSDVQAIGAGVTVSIQPAAAFDWVVHDVGSDQWIGAAPNGVPNIEVDLDDGTLTARILSSVNVRQWEAELKLYCDNADYVTLTNSALVQANICWSAEVLRYSGAGATINRSDVQTAGAGANVDFIPVAGEEWKITMIGSSAWAGIAPAQIPNITASIFDGVNAATLMNNANWRLNGHQFEVIVNNANYLRINDASGAGQQVGISAVLGQRYA